MTKDQIIEQKKQKIDLLTSRFEALDCFASSVAKEMVVHLKDRTNVETQLRTLENIRQAVLNLELKENVLRATCPITESEWKQQYYSQFVNTTEAEEFRSICYFAANTYKKIQENPKLEFKFLCEEWQKVCDVREKREATKQEQQNEKTA